jgi:hypothetical protein
LEGGQGRGLGIPGLKLGRVTLVEDTHTNPVPTAKIKQSAVKANPLMLFREPIGIYCK